MYNIVDFRSKEKVSTNNFVFTGDVSPWEVQMDLEEIRSKLQVDYFKKSPPFVSKYLPFLPIKSAANFVSLDEGSTPLILSERLGKEFGIKLYYKLEANNPTGSFKDRGSAVELSIAKELNVKAITVASTGNMAASCSCYAASAQIPCFVFVPEDTPPSKLAQVIAYGGRIVQVKGSYGDAAQMAVDVAKDLNFYLAGDYAFRVEGHKTAAFELIDQLYYREPDYVIVPMGCGTNIASYAKGFDEYRKLGFIEQIPKLIGVQAEGASPIVKSFLNDSPLVVEPNVRSIASAISINNPLDFEKAIHSMKSTSGHAISVTDREILEAQYWLSREEGLYVETAGASAVAALRHLVKSQNLEGKTIVCVLTGAGLKDPNPVLKIAVKPPTLSPKVKDFLSLYKRGFFDGKPVSFINKDEVIYSTLPKAEELKAYLQEHFNFSYSSEHVSQIQSVIETFLKKGKKVTFLDLQDIIQDQHQNLTKKSEKILSVEDFEVSTAKNKKALAKVKVKINGVEHEKSAHGVGPFDALMNALKQAAHVSFSLAGYSVDIRSHGTDAVVYVEIKLTKDGRVSIGEGASPDILQASISAFEEAYNSLEDILLAD